MAIDIQQFIQESRTALNGYWNDDYVNPDNANAVADRLEQALSLLAPMKSYQAAESLNYDSEHALRIVFQFEDRIATVYTTLGGNIAGGDVLEGYTDLFTGLTAPSDHPINKRYCEFDEEEDTNYKEVTGILFYDEQGDHRILLDLEQAQEHIVKLEILDYKEKRE